MPEYFFHIALEFVESATLNTEQPPNLSHYFKSLKPFTRPQGRLSSRDHTFDRVKTTRRPATPTKSQSEKQDHREDSSPLLPEDHRPDHISIECLNMAPKDDSEISQQKYDHGIGKGIGTTMSGIQTRGRYEQLEQDEENAGWGVVHLYRDVDETPGLYKDSGFKSTELWIANTIPPTSKKTHPPAKDEECSTLCILAVPSYMTPSDFLAFVGEETCAEVSHFRMIKTARANRYMVLMKFKNGKRARIWQHEWNGKIFNSMEPETCHVVFLKSVEILQQPDVSELDGLRSPGESTTSTMTHPRLGNDAFLSSSATAKPPAPRTPALVELPTCPVCLERMDETSGLLTILCQHVFHCTCLQKWSGGGCPVCRYTHDDFSTRVGGPQKYKSKVSSGEYEVSGPLECETCRTESSLWQCLICGKVGCGRYEGRHAYQHFEKSGHTFSMDLENKRVWDYAGDGYVHRIISDAARPGEKLIELPGRRQQDTALEEINQDMDMAKMENLSLEYTHLLTSQLESQRVYFEGIVERAVDKAAEATRKADRAMEESRLATSRLRELESKHDFVAKGRVPDLEREKARLEKRNVILEKTARDVNQRYLEEKTMAGNLMVRIKDMEAKMSVLEEDMATKDLLTEGLREEHRDAMMQVAAMGKLREMVQKGEIEASELEGATVEAGPRKGQGSGGRRKGGGKG